MEKEIKLMLAPMAGYTDRHFRRICASFGADIAVTEMVSAKALCYEQRGKRRESKSASLAHIEGGIPTAVQLFGSEPEFIAEAVRLLASGEYRGNDSAERPCAIDINMGCPVKKVVSNGEGSALMRDPELIRKIVLTVRGTSPVPVTVKLRAGIDGENRNAVECAMAAEDGGASLITVHGRTRVEFYSGRADREIIKNVKKSVHIPVIANGDVTSGEEALAMLRETGADGIAVGRGAVGNPFVFAEIRAAIFGESYTPPSLGERIDTALEQLRLSVREKGERVAVVEARKQIAAYFTSFRGASALRASINRAESSEEVKTLLSYFAKANGENS